MRRPHWLFRRLFRFQGALRPPAGRGTRSEERRCRWCLCWPTRWSSDRVAVPAVRGEGTTYRRAGAPSVNLLDDDQVVVALAPPEQHEAAVRAGRPAPTALVRLGPLAVDVDARPGSSSRRASLFDAHEPGLGQQVDQVEPAAEPAGDRRRSGTSAASTSKVGGVDAVERSPPNSTAGGRLGRRGRLGAVDQRRDLPGQAALAVAALGAAVVRGDDRVDLVDRAAA